MTAEGRAASFPSAAPLAVGLIHAVLFVFAGWTAVATAGGFLIGPFEAAPFFPVLAVILVGGIRVAAGAAGGRALLLAGDLGLAGLLAAKPLLHDPEFLELPSAWYLALAALALVAALIAGILVPRPVHGSIVRRPRDRTLLVALIVSDVVTTLWSAAANADAARMDVGAYAVELAAETAPFDIALFGAWWWASRWPLGLTGAAGLLVGLSSTAFAAVDPLRWAVFIVPYLLSVVAGLVGPAPAGVATPTTAPGPSRSRPATVWIAVGAIGWPLLVFAGSFPIVLDACLECGPRFPGDSLVWLLGVLTVVAVPICGLLAITTGGSRPEAADPFRWILLAGSGVVLLEILAGAAGVLRFGFLG
ncbi:MAG TPA: hypothetical protein VFJ71_11820, partial [Candidatus Limnocylindrales bacterium]|nr:hypothetical protein [Candidatus Limnocylindrales bacterium]